MKKIRKILSVFLVIVMFVTVAPLSEVVVLDLNFDWFNFTTKASAENSVFSGIFGENVTWNYDEATCTLTFSGTGRMNSYWDDEYGACEYIPWYGHFIENVVVESGITNIGAYLSYSFSGLKSVTIPASVTEIGEDAFDSCSSITDVYYSGDIAEWCAICANFASNPAIYAEHIYINGELISGELIIPAGVTSISSYAFYNCDDITSVTIPNGVTKIGAYAFYECTNLSEIVIGDDVTDIGRSAFSDTAYYNDASNWSDKILYVGDYLIASKTDITGQCEIRENTKTIIDYAFSGCTAMTGIVLPLSIKNLGSGAFSGCSGLTGIFYPGTKEQWFLIDANADVTDLVVFEYDSDSPYYSGYCGENMTWSYYYETNEIIISGTGEMYEEDYYDDYCFPWADYHITSIVIENGVTSIAFSAFGNCDNVEKVVIHGSVKSMESAFRQPISNCDFYVEKGSYAEHYLSNTYLQEVDSVYIYYLCTESEEKIVSEEVSSKLSFELNKETYTLTINCLGDMPGFQNEVAPWAKYQKYIQHVIINEGCKSISDRFCEYSGIKSIILPASLISIGEYAFAENYKLETLTIGNAEMTIGDYAFLTSYYDESAPRLSALYFNGSLADWCSNNVARYLLPNTTKFYVDGKLVEGEIVIPDGVTSIADYSFVGRNTITAVKLPDSVIDIGDYSFYGCKKITSVKIPDSVTSIGHSVFRGCSGLTDIEIPDVVTSIGSYAFYGCSGLVDIEIPDVVTSIGSYAFYGCSRLTDIKIPAGLTVIESCSFSGCKGITEIIIPHHITSIGNSAFANCTELGDVVIPYSVQSIGSGAFAGCQKIGKLKIYNRNCSFDGDFSSYYTTICGYEGSTAEVYANKNVFDFELLSDDDHQHIYSEPCDNKCNICGTVDTARTHTFDDNCDAECNYCDFLRKPPHTDENADGICDVCELPLSDIGVGVTENFYVSAGETVYIKFVPGNSGVYTYYSTGSLNTFGYVFDADKNQLASDDNSGEGYNFSITYTFRAGTVYYLGAKFVNSGTLGDIALTIRLDEPICDHRKTHIDHKDPTCSEVGFNKVICDDCGEVVSNTELPFADHSTLRTEHKDSTCSEYGYDKIVCDDCGKTVSNTVLPLVAHTALRTEHKDSTCSENGYDKVICDDCEKTVSFVKIPMIDHSYKTIVADPTCKDEGTVVCFCTVCRYVSTVEITAPLGHSGNWEIITPPTDSTDGIKIFTCSTCGEVVEAKILYAIAPSEESVALIDFERNTIYGLAAGTTSLDEYLILKNDGYIFVCDDETIGTGSLIKLTDGETVIREFTVVIYGDVDGDGWYDGQDAVPVSCLANGMLTKDDVSEAVYMAADCNHDGAIDQLDVDLLNQAGTLLSSVDQSKPA